jgi:hypothetical protein
LVVRSWQLKLLGVVALVCLSTAAVGREVTPKADTTIAVRKTADSHSERVGTLVTIVQGK